MRLPRPHRTAVVVGAQRCFHPRGTRQAPAIGRDVADVLLGAGTLSGGLARRHEPQPLVHGAGTTGWLRRRAVGRPRPDPHAQTGRGPRPRDRRLRVRAVLGHRRVPVRWWPGFHRAVGSPEHMHRRRRPLPAAAHRAARRAADPRRGQRPGGGGRNRARAGRPAAAVRPGDLAGGVFQAAWARCAGDLRHCSGPIRDAQGHDVPALRFGLPARKHVRRGANGPRQPGQDRSLAATDHGPARPHSTLTRLERREGVCSPRHHPDARTGEPLDHE